MRPKMEENDRFFSFMNDKFQTFADFDTLESLIGNVASKEKLLRQQLEHAERELQSTAARSEQQDAEIRSQFQAYEREASDVDRRLRIITQSETSDDAIRRFDESMKKLDRLEIANGYFNLMAGVERLSAQSISALEAKPADALEPYAQLYDLKLKLKTLQYDADGAAPHLLDHVDSTTWHVRQTIKETFAAALNKILETILWPRPDSKLPRGLQEQWMTVCNNLLALQKPELLNDVHEADPEARNYVESSSALLPLEIMVRPLEQRFRYHFDGHKPTNRLDKPEYFLSHVLDLFNTYMPFIVEVFQPVLAYFASGTYLTFHPSYIDASAAFIDAVLPMLRTKLFSLVPRLLDQPNLLSHLIYELMSFDDKLREEWHYAGNELNIKAWKGLTGEILTEHDWFDRWLQVEKDFALTRYESIVNDNDSNSIDYDTVDSKLTKPTRAAIRVNDLLETVTDLYRPLSSFSKKLRFLIEVQLSIFDQFHLHLNSGLEAFLSMVSPFGRTMKGASESDVASIQGVKGLDRLCRIFGSADYLERALRGWSDETFFLDLWNELQHRVNADSTESRGNSDQQQAVSPVAGNLSISEIAMRTSSKLTGPNEGEAVESELAPGALFEETGAAYARLRARSEQIIIDTLTSSLFESLRPYGRTNPWSSLSSSETDTSSQPDGNAEESLTASVDLSPVLNELSSSLGFLTRTLGNLALRRIVRKAMRNLDGHIFDNVVLKNTFSLRGAKQFAVDVETLALLINKIVGTNLGSGGLNRCMEARTLLMLPNSSLGTASNRDGHGETLNSQEDSSKQRNGHQFGIWEVESRVFESNESARDILEELGLDLLTENDARKILGRRVELDR